MRLGDIEGQEFGLGDGSDSLKLDEPEDRDAAERRKKAGMGYELSSFNMREEMEEGKFSAGRSHILKLDPHTIRGRWLDTDEKGSQTGENMGWDLYPEINTVEVGVEPVHREAIVNSNRILILSLRAVHGTPSSKPSQ